MKYTVAEFRKNTREILNAVDQGAEVLIQRYDTLYKISPTVRGDSALPFVHEPMQKEMAKKNIAVGKPTKKKAVPAGVAPVDSCPHGYAKGFCKKTECNRKYAK